MNRIKSMIGLALILLAAMPALALDFGESGKTTPTAQSNTALPLLKMELDVENDPGWLVSIKGGFQWKMFRDQGYTIKENGVRHSVKSNRTNSGAAGSICLGYNFGDLVPVTLGLGVGMGPDGNFTTKSSYNNGVEEVSMLGRQKMRFYTLDFALDYEFKNSSRWTPYAGVIGGVSIVQDKGHISLTDSSGTRGAYHNWRKRYNLVGGAELGVKFQMNERVTLSLQGSYEYLGSVKARSFDLHGAQASARRTRVHQLDAKMGVKIHF